MGQSTRRWWLLASLSTPFAVALNAQNLVVSVSPANFLHIAAPQLHFLTGKPLEHLKDGATVAFWGQLSVSTDANATIRARAIARFAMSYDIWEERFSVSRFPVTKPEKPLHSISHLSAQAAEAWCLEHLSLDVSQWPQDKPVWVRLEWRAEDGREEAGVIGDPGINLTRLIELFSRPARAKQSSWQLDAGPLRLADCKKIE